LTFDNSIDDAQLFTFESNFGGIGMGMESFGFPSSNYQPPHKPQSSLYQHQQGPNQAGLYSHKKQSQISTPPQLMSRIPSAAPAAESPTSLTGVKKTEAESEIEKNIKKVIEEKIAAGIQADGGDIHFVGYIPDKQLVEIALTGACESCDRSAITLQILVTNALKHYFPGDIEKVKRVYLPGQEQH